MKGRERSDLCERCVSASVSQQLACSVTTVSHFSELEPNLNQLTRKGGSFPRWPRGMMRICQVKDSLSQRERGRSHKLVAHPLGFQAAELQNTGDNCEKKSTRKSNRWEVATAPTRATVQSGLARGRGNGGMLSWTLLALLSLISVAKHGLQQRDS